MKFTILCSTFVCLLFAACHSSQTTQNDTQDIKKHLRIDEVTLSKFKSTYITVGTVRAEAGKLAEVGLPIDGRIGQSFVHLGQKVQKGTPLFAVFSPVFADQSKAYFQAESNFRLKQKEYARKQTLRESGIASMRELEEAENELELAKREVTQWEHTIAALGIDVTELKTSGEMNICSPIAGEIVRMELTTGQYVRQDEPALVTVVDLSNIWVSAQLKEYYLGRVHKDDSVEVYLHMNDNYHTTGKIVYIGQLLDPDTRSVEVLVSCNNSSKKFKPGMFAHIHFTAPQTDAIQIAASAVMQGQNETYVYVVNGDSLSRRTIEVETGEEGKMHVLSGLNVGEHIIGDGGIYLSNL